MSWRDNFGRITLPDGRELIAGSFRGVAFRTTSAELTGGRRNVLNQYPQRDVPYSDDMGREARSYVVEAYLVGDDYLAQRDALQAALETAGPGELRHPRYGILTVALSGKFSFKESPDRGGYCSVSVTFVEDGPNTFPQASTNTVAQVESTANAADDAAAQAFEDEFDATGPSVLGQQAEAAVGADVAGTAAMAQQVAGTEALAGVLGLAGTLVAGLDVLVRAPGLLAAQLRGLGAALIDGLAWPLAALQSFDLVFLNNAQPLPAAFVASTLARSQANDVARGALNRRLAITNQARALTIVLGSGAVATREQALVLRAAVLRNLDTELETNAPPVLVARALAQLRVALVRDVAARAEMLQRSASYTPATVLPALVLAHRVYQDAGRADELVARNAIKHPAFVPAAALEVLR